MRTVTTSDARRSTGSSYSEGRRLKLDLCPDLDDAVRGDRKEVRRRAGVAREEPEEALAPGRHAAALAREQRLAAEVEARLGLVQIEALPRAGAQDADHVGRLHEAVVRRHGPEPAIEELDVDEVG